MRKRIKQLVQPGPPTQGEDPYWVLRKALVGSGTWSDASAPAVTLLLGSVATAGDPTPLLLIAGDILGGDQLRGWLSPPDVPTERHERAAHDAAVEKKAVLMGALSSDSGVVRGAAAMLLAMVPGLAAESVPALVAVALEDAYEIARAGALLALGRLGIGSAAAAKVIESSRVADAPPLVRGAGGIAWLRQDAKRPFDEAKGEIVQWLGRVPPEGVKLPWFDAPHWIRTLSFPDAPARALLGLGRSRGDAGIDALVGIAVLLAGIDDGVVEAQLAKIMLDLGGFSRESTPTVALPEELSNEQRTFAKKLAETHLLPAGGHGLPASGAIRRRWMGIDPKGPLDRVVESPGGQAAPLWRVWQKQPVSPGDFASPIDRWQALVEYASGSYPPFFRGPKLDEVETEIAAVPVNAEMLARAHSLGDDLSRRFAAVARTEMIAHLYLNVSMLFLLPLIRAGHPIPEDWDVLVYVGIEPQARELLEAIPLDRRERRLVDSLRAGNAATRWGRASVGLGLVDLAPTRRMAESLRSLIGLIGEGPDSQRVVTELSARLEQATRLHPSLAS